MPSAHANPTDDCRLRIVFDRQVLSFGIAAGATFGDVARKLRALPRKKYGEPLAANVMVAGRAMDRRSASARH